jgi:hypothetical protein
MLCAHPDSTKQLTGTEHHTIAEPPTMYREFDLNKNYLATRRPGNCVRPDEHHDGFCSESFA